MAALILFFHKTLCLMEKASHNDVLPVLCQKAKNTSYTVSDKTLSQRFIGDRYEY